MGLQRSTKPKIVFSFPSFESGGAEKASKLYFKALKTKVDIVWIASVDTVDLSTDLRLSGSWVSKNNISRKYRLLIHQFKLIKYLLLNPCPFTLISFQGHVLTIPILKFLSFVMHRKVNIIFRESNDVKAYMMKEINSRYKRFIFRYVLKGFPAFLADHVIVNSNGSKMSFLEVTESTNHKIVCVYNPFFLDSEPHLMNSAAKCYEFGFVGRLVDQKQPLHFLEMCWKLKATGKRFSAIISGDGVLFEPVKKKIKDLGLEDTVILKGYNDDLYDKIKTLVLTSAYEGLPNVILEGISRGCEVVSYDCKSGPREILPVRNLIEQDQIEDLVLRCAETLEIGYQPELIERAQLEKFRADAFIQKIEKLLH